MAARVDIAHTPSSGQTDIPYPATGQCGGHGGRGDGVLWRGVRDLHRKRALIVGSGETSALAARHLLSKGVERMSIDLLVKEAKHVAGLGVPAMALFPVTPASAKAVVRAQNSRRASGSTPEVGSSRNSSLGLCSSPCTMPTFFLLP